VLRKRADAPSKATIPDLEFKKTELKNGQKWQDGEKALLDDLDGVKLSDASKKLLKACVYKKR